MNSNFKKFKKLKPSKMNEVAYIIDGVKYNNDDQIIKNIREDKTELKRLDRFFNKLNKFTNEDVSVKIVNMVKTNGFVETLVFSLKIEDVKTAYLLSTIGKEIEFYKKAIQNNMSTLIMVSLSSPLSMKIALDLESAVYPIPMCGRLNDEMVVCLYRHAMVFPKNKEICMGCIRSYNFEESFLFRPFFFFQDEAEMVRKYFTKDKSVKNIIFNNTIDHGAINIMDKAIKYYNQDIKVMAKLSLPILLKNTKKFSIYENKKEIIQEVILDTRWDFLPFIFENYKFDITDWEKIKFPIYQGMATVPFVQTLFYLMKKHDIDFNKIYEEGRTVFCSLDVWQIFKDFGIENNFKFETRTKFTRIINSYVSNMFEFYLNDDSEMIVDQLFISYAHKNNRFMEEKEFVLNLVNEDKLGWTKEIKNKFLEFNNFCNEFCQYLSWGDLLILEYNSYISVSLNLPHMMGIRFLNKISRIIYNIKNEFLKKEYMTIIMRFEEEYWKVMSKVRDDIGLGYLEEREIWKLPENPTLEELFIDLYQHSMYNYRNDEYSHANKIVESLKQREMYKIASEVEMAIASLIPSEDIEHILKIKNITFDFQI